MQGKCEQTSYAERRAFAMNDDAFDLEEEVHMAIEDINSKEKDLAQLIQVTNFLFERNDELIARESENVQELRLSRSERTEFDLKFGQVQEQCQSLQSKLDSFELHCKQLESEQTQSLRTQREFQSQIRVLQDVQTNTTELKMELEDQLLKKTQELDQLQEDLAQKLPSLERELQEVLQELATERQKRFAEETIVTRYRKDLDDLRAAEKTQGKKLDKKDRALTMLRKEVKSFEE